MKTFSDIFISMGSCKEDITPLLMHWSCIFLALTHRFVFLETAGNTPYKGGKFIHISSIIIVIITTIFFVDVLTLNMLNCFKDYKKIYSHFESYLGSGFNQVDEINIWNNTCCLSYTVNIMSVDALATLVASASAGMVLIPKKRNIPSAASNELRFKHCCNWQLYK